MDDPNRPTLRPRTRDEAVGTSAAGAPLATLIALLPLSLGLFLVFRAPWPLFLLAGFAGGLLLIVVLRTVGASTAARPHLAPRSRPVEPAATDGEAGGDRDDDGTDGSPSGSDGNRP